MTDNSPAPKILKLAQECQNLTDEEKRQLAELQLNPHRLGYAEADTWQLFTLADAYEPRQPVEYITGSLFELPSLNIVYGSPGCLKSFWLADLAVCVSGGMDWLTPAPWIDNPQNTARKTKPNPVMWLDFDNGRRRTHDRFAALGRARDVPAESQLSYYSMPAPWLDSGNNKDMGLLLARIMSTSALLVVVDNLGNVSGDADENSAEMGAVMSQWRQLAEETQAAVVLIHHQRKGSMDGSRAGDSLRGHSSIEASLDLALNIKREEYSDTINIKATKVRGADVNPFGAAFTYEHDQAGELFKARFFGLPGETAQTNAAIDDAILEALKGANLNKTSLVNATRNILKENIDDGKLPGINRIRNRIDQMAALRSIHKSAGRNNTEVVYAIK